MYNNKNNTVIFVKRIIIRKGLHGSQINDNAIMLIARRNLGELDKGIFVIISLRRVVIWE